MIDFPASPTVGQTFTAAGVTWTYDGAKWTVGTLAATYLPLSGGTLVGDLILNRDAQVPLGAATLEQVQARGAGDNRIINGDFRIDQRNNGASGTATQTYTIDRWFYGSGVAGKITWGRGGPAAGTQGPTGSPYWLGFTTTTAYTAAAADIFNIAQKIEADMVSDFAFGTANAQPITLSFWANHTIAGTFSGSIANDAGTRSYPFTYSIPTANTWTKIIVPIPGDTGGTWVMGGNALAMYARFDLGSGANTRGPPGAWASANYVGVTGTIGLVATQGAICNFTGVKLEIGSVATPFNRQSLAKSMADCQRYYLKVGGAFGGDVILQQQAGAASQNLAQTIIYPVSMRAAATGTVVGGIAGQTNVGAVNLYPGIQSAGFQITATASGATNWQSSGTSYLTFSAEL